MKRFSTHSLGIQQGSLVLFSDFADDGAMWSGEGPRASRHLVTFPEAFIDVPTVTVSISMWDMDQATNSRADIASEAISATDFMLVFKTWGDSRVARIRADWVAFGPIKDDDAWDVP